MDFPEFLKQSKKYVINLDIRPDRLEKFMLRSKEQGLEVTRFPAIDGITIDKFNIPYPPDNRPNARAPTNYQDMSRGQTGCALSHLTLMENCKDINLIFEDDAIFSDQFLPMCNKYFPEVEFGDKCHLVIFGHDQATEYGSPIQVPTWNCHAYAYDKVFAQEFIRHIHTYGLFCVDINLIEFMMKYDKYRVITGRPSTVDLERYHIDPSQRRSGGLVYQDTGLGSDIGRGL